MRSELLEEKMIVWLIWSSECPSARGWTWKDVKKLRASTEEFGHFALVDASLCVS